MGWLRSARTASGELVDVEITGGRIAQVTAANGKCAADDTDLTGQVLLPSFVEPHAHLDKALTASRAGNVTGDLPGAIEAMRAMLPSLTVEDFTARAEAALRLQLGYGTTSIRTHVNVGAGLGMRALAALVEVRERWRGLVDLQLVALVSNPLDGQAGRDLRQALREGADVAGGCPHLDPAPDRAVAICLDAAGEAGVPLDLHTDESLDPRKLSLATLADLVSRTGFAYGVTASHCVSLAVQQPHVQQRVSEQVSAAGIAVVALPQTNLFLQWRRHVASPPSGRCVRRERRWLRAATTSVTRSIQSAGVTPWKWRP
jgi:cytosine deaminase